jgi:hypothetical protein
VNDYLEKFKVTAKDLRGLHANLGMRKALKKVRSEGGKLPTDEKKRKAQLKKEFQKALEETAEAVGHESSTLAKDYLTPGVETDFLRDGTVTDTMVKAVVLRYASDAS